MPTHQYHYHAEWSEAEQQFIGRCAEFPDLECHATDQFDALEDIRLLVEHTVADMERRGERVPGTSVEQMTGQIPITSERIAVARQTLEEIGNDENASPRLRARAARMLKRNPTDQ